jgi:hypothetical protein
MRWRGSPECWSCWRGGQGSLDFDTRFGKVSGRGTCGSVRPAQSSDGGRHMSQNIPETVVQRNTEQGNSSPAGDWKSIGELARRLVEKAAK